MKLPWLIGAVVCMLQGCSLRFIDTALPSDDELWLKNGFTTNMIEVEVRDCIQKIPKELKGQAGYDSKEQCMIDKGFKYNGDWRYGGRICEIFPNNIGCKSLRK